MKKIASIFFVISMMFMCAACASFDSVKKTDEFLAAEKATGIKPKTVMRVATLAPTDNAAFALASNLSDLGFLPFVSTTAFVVEISAKIAKSEMSASIASATPEEEMWRQVIATTDYGRFVEYKRGKDTVGAKQPLPSIFDNVVQEVGAPPLPCGLVGKNFDPYYRKKFKFIPSHKWSFDKTNNTFIGYAKKLKYSLIYATVLPENNVPGQAPAICTPQMAEEHFSKIVKIMENR